MIDYGQYDKQWKEQSTRMHMAIAHELGRQVLDFGRFFASLPYHAERGVNYITGRHNQAFSGLHERQTQLFQKAEDWMYRAMPTDRTHADYGMYRRNTGLGIEAGSLAAGGYGLLKGGMKAARWGANTWRMRRGTFVAGEKLGGISQPVKGIHATHFSSQLPVGHMWHNSSPFKKKTAEELHRLFLKKEFEIRGKDPIRGYGNYINLKNGRQYHIDPKNHGRYQEPNHVDISRPKNYTGTLKKKRFEYADD